MKIAIVGAPPAPSDPASPPRQPPADTRSPRWPAQAGREESLPPQRPLRLIDANDTDALAAAIHGHDVQPAAAADHLVPSQQSRLSSPLPNGVPT